MHRLIIVSLILLCCLLNPSVGTAQPQNKALDDDNKEPLELEDVVVTGEKIQTTYQTGDVDLETTPASYSVITREAFEGREVSLPEVIEKEVGVQVRQTGGVGSFASVSLRGSGSDQVMVYLDGVLLNDASGGGVDLGSISLSDVAAIEVFRGTAPINFGQSSIGGVINIRTQQPSEGFTSSALAGYGSFNTRNLTGFLNAKPNRWDFLVSADYLASDNDFEILNDNGTEWNPADDAYEQRNNAQVEQYNVLARTGVDLTDDTRLDLVNQWFKEDQGLPRWDNSPDTSASLDTERNITTLKLTANDLGSMHLNTGTQVSYTWKSEDYDDRNGDIGLGAQYNTYTTRKFGADIFAEWLPEAQAVILSANLQRETYEVEDRLKGEDTADSLRTIGTLGLQDSVFMFQERLIVTPACRYTWVANDLGSSARCIIRRPHLERRLFQPTDRRKIHPDGVADPPQQPGALCPHPVFFRAVRRSRVHCRKPRPPGRKKPQLRPGGGRFLAMAAPLAAQDCALRHLFQKRRGRPDYPGLRRQRHRQIRQHLRCPDPGRGSRRQRRSASVLAPHPQRHLAGPRKPERHTGLQWKTAAGPI